MSHLDEGTIHAWLDGALPADEAARVEAHARDCTECSAMVAEARGFIAGASRIVSSLDIVRGDVIPAAVSAPAKPTHRGSLWRTLKLTPARAAIAATLLVAVASMLTLRDQNIEPASSGARRLADSALPASAPAPMRADTFVVNQPKPEHVAPEAARGAPVMSAQRAAAMESKATDAPKSRVPTADAVTANNAIAPAAPPALAAERKVATPAAAPAVASSIAPAAAEPAPARARRAIPDSQTRLMEVVTTGAAPRDAASKFARGAAGATAQAPIEASVSGCYRLQVERPADVLGFPAQFRLAHDSTNGSHPVYAINADRDSVLNGAGWRVLRGTTVLVSGTDARFGSVQISFAADSAKATVRSVAATVPATIQRTPCTR